MIPIPSGGDVVAKTYIDIQFIGWISVQNSSPGAIVKAV